MTSKGSINIRTFSASQIRGIDQKAIKRYGIPSLVLMENAGRAVTAEVIKQLKRERGKTVSIICGTGNNGGDGFVAARQLNDVDIPVHVFLAGQPSQLKLDALTNFKVLKNSGVPIRSVAAITTAFKKSISHSSVVVDAIFGVGLDRKISEPIFSIIELINHVKKRIVAVDVPSGLDATTGNILGTCVRADVTVTFSAPKKGFYKNDGPYYAGYIKVIDIGIPKKLLKKI